MKVHVYAPEPTSTTYRILPWRHRNFTPGRYADWRAAFEAGMAGHERGYRGFRVFRQMTYEWHEPMNQEIIKVYPRLAKDRGGKS